MAKAVFISFDHDDANQVGGLRAALTNPNNNIEFLDRSLKEPVKDSYGNPIVVKPDDSRAKKVKSEIINLMESSSKMVVLIGKNTHSSDWVKWEINTFIRLKKDVSRKIICMRLKGNKIAGKPNNADNFDIMNWDLEQLLKWINS